MVIIVAGATGEVGKEIIKQLVAWNNAQTWTIIALVRTEGSKKVPTGGVQEIRFDFDRPEAYEQLIAHYRPNIFFCALGTTLKKAKSAGAFKRVDRDYPAQFIHALCKCSPGTRVGLVSSVGADRGGGLYLTTKKEVEEIFFKSHLAGTVVRPSLLLSHREEFRLGEKLGAEIIAPAYLLFVRTFFPNWNALWKFAPIETRQVAATLVSSVIGLGSGEPQKENPKVQILEGLALFK